MARTMCSNVVVLVTLMIALAAASVRAQINCGVQSDVRNGMADACQLYLTEYSLESTPDSTCCGELVHFQSMYGSSCYCQLLVTVDFAELLVNVTRAYTLPQDCGVLDANMSNCPDPLPPASAIPPPGNMPPPPSAGLLAPPAASFLTPPPGTTTTPPGFTTPTGPTSGTPSAPATGSTARKSLALPIGAAIGGLIGGGLIIGIIWLILSRCKTAPAVPSHIPGEPVSDNYGDKVPASMNGYDV